MVDSPANLFHVAKGKVRATSPPSTPVAGHTARDALAKGQGTSSLQLTSIFLSALIRTCITTTKLPSLGFQRLLSTQRDIEKLFSVPGLSIAPGLFTVLRARDPPTLAWFKGLPFCKTSKDWAVYSLILERPNSKPRLYIGTATARNRGLNQRMEAYDSQHITMPRFVTRALEEGFVITMCLKLAFTQTVLSS